MSNPDTSLPADRSEAPRDPGTLSGPEQRTYPDVFAYVTAMAETVLQDPANVMDPTELAEKYPPVNTGVTRHLEEIGGLKPGVAFVGYVNGTIPEFIYFVSKDGRLKRLPVPAPGVVTGIGNFGNLAGFEAHLKAGDLFIEEFKELGFTVPYTFRDDFIGHYLHGVFHRRDDERRRAEEAARAASEEQTGQPVTEQPVAKQPIKKPLMF